MIRKSVVKWNDKKFLKITMKEVDDKLEQCADNVRDDAKSICPVKTGAARNSIEALKSKYKDGGYIIKGGGGDEYYFTYLELGSVRHTPVAPLRKSLQKNKRKIKEIFNAK